MSTNKRLTHVMAGLLFLTVMLSGCSHLGSRSIDTDSRQVHSVTFTKSDRSHHDPFPEPIRTEDGWHMESATSPVRKYDAFPTAHGPVLITGNEDKQIISLDAGTGSVNWRLTMSTGIGSEESIAATPQTGVPTHQVVVSPNGRYLAIRTHSYLDPEDSENIGDQRVGITVLDAETGETVRTVEVSGLVLGQAIVNDSLVVETALNYYPAGAGVLNVFSLTDPDAEPVTTRTDNWLVGSTKDSLLMSPQSSMTKKAEWRQEEFHRISTIVRTNTSGETLKTITGVTAIHPNGWIERAKNPQKAAEAAASPEKTPLAALPRDLINIDSGASVDATGQYVTSVNLPTGPGLLLRTLTTTGEGEEKKTTYINHSWLPATSDSTEPRTNDMQQIDLDNKANKVFSKPIRMGEEEK